MIDAIFLNPPFLKKFSRAQRSPAVTRSGTMYYPIWLCYASSYCEQNGFITPVVDAVCKNYGLSDIFSLIKKELPKAIFIDTSTPSFSNDIKIAQKIKGFVPGIKLFLVGPFASAKYIEIINDFPWLDGVCVGEYERTSFEILQKIKNKEELKVDGLYTIKFKGDKRLPWKNIEDFGFVSRIYKKYLRISDYFNPNSLYPMITIVTGRDCPNACSFCVYPQTLHYKGYRPRPIKEVIAELDYIKETFPEVKGIFFEDDTFTANHKRVSELCTILSQKRYPFLFSANCRADVPEELLILMKKAGFRQICVGFESGCQEILDNVKKNISLEKAEVFAKNAFDAGLKVHGCFMFGIPGETKETMKKTLEYALRLPLDTAQFYPLMPYPGTKIYDQLKNAGLLAFEDYALWLDNNGKHNTVIRIPDMTSEEIVGFCNYCRKAFYLRPIYILAKIKEAILNPFEGIRLVKGFANLFFSLIKDRVFKL